MTALIWIAFGLALGLGVLACLLVMYGRFTPPVGRTLQERYPAAPGAFVTSYSSIDLPEEAFVKEPRRYPVPALTVNLTRTPHEIVIQAEAGPVVARIWDGVTAHGIRVHAYVLEVRAVYEGDAAALERALKGQGS